MAVRDHYLETLAELEHQLRGIPKLFFLSYNHTILKKHAAQLPKSIIIQFWAIIYLFGLSKCVLFTYLGLPNVLLFTYLGLPNLIIL
ncbi:hypothetical protein HanRHA438_Chr16g0769581 [Helianthus annuus]|nr:hypothetical protein HanRHA438_Chr16g0769581 [Helianthus annuus]